MFAEPRQPLPLNVVSCIGYIVAKLGAYVLRDFDVLPLQGDGWQTDLVNFYVLLSDTFSLLVNCPNLK